MTQLAYKAFTKAIVLVAGTTQHVELKDTGGSYVNCTFADIYLSDTAAAGKYLHVSPSANTGSGTNYLNINISVSAGQFTSGAGGVTVAPTEKATITTHPPFTFQALVLKPNITAAGAVAIINYGVRRQVSEMQDKKTGNSGA